MFPEKYQLYTPSFFLIRNVGVFVFLVFINFFFLLFFVVLGAKHRTLCISGKHPITELHSQSPLY